MAQKVIALIALAVILTGCSATTRAQFCDVARPYYFMSRDEIARTDPDLVRHIVDLNTKGRELCGWRKK
jgi:hypothetical protein